MANRNYARLLPAARPQRNSSPEASNSGLVRKRTRDPRSVVSVACNNCRRKKIKCDGHRPACFACEGDTAQCLYRDDQKRTIGESPAFDEAVHLLSSLPEGQFYQVLKALRSQARPEKVASVLRGGIDLNAQPSSLATASAALEQSSVSLELGAQNPIAYPFLTPMRDVSIEQDTLDRLTQSRGGSSTQPSNTMPAQQSMTPPETKPDSFSTSFVNTSASIENERREENGATLCDSRLKHLKIGYWTPVPIGDALASRAISLYMETDHPLLGFFEPSLFIADLVDHKTDFCSAALVNALLYWACQMYATIDKEAQGFASSFRAEAERLWLTERHRDTVLNMATAQFLSLAYIGQGRDHAVLMYLAEASDMGTRMGLFGVDTVTGPRFSELTPNVRSAHKYASWGVFNWIIFMSLFYHQPGMVCPKYPPQLPPPGNEDLEAQGGVTLQNQDIEPSTPMPNYMGRTFPHLCNFWRILHEVVMEYYGNGKKPLGAHVDATFAEFKFRELLAWSNTLPSALKQDGTNPHHVLILHVWFHAAVLDIFRPFVSGPLQAIPRLRTFSSPELSAGNVFEASVNQLKRLIVNYRAGYKSSAYTILWHTALVYVANAVLQTADESESGLFYFLLCLYGYEGLRRSWRMTEAVVGGLLSMRMRDGGISSINARQILDDVRGNGLSHKTADIRATFMVDLDLALTDPNVATAEALASDFEGHAAIKDLTTVLDDEEMT